MTIRLSNIAICEGVQHNKMNKARIDVLAVDDTALAEDIDHYIDENVISYMSIEIETNSKVENLKSKKLKLSLKTKYEECYENCHIQKHDFVCKYKAQEKFSLIKHVLFCKEYKNTKKMKNYSRNTK